MCVSVIVVVAVARVDRDVAVQVAVHVVEVACVAVLSCVAVVVGVFLDVAVKS